MGGWFCFGSTGSKGRRYTSLPLGRVESPSRFSSSDGQGTVVNKVIISRDKMKMHELGTLSFTCYTNPIYLRR